MTGRDVVQFFQRYPECLDRKVECITPPHVMIFLSVEDVFLIEGCAVFKTEGNIKEDV